MNQIELLPEEVTPGKEGHIDDHKIIHEGLKDHESRLTQAEEEVGAKSDTDHKHAAEDITSGTISVQRLPVGSAAGTIAAGNDPRLTDTRTPKAHTHAISDVTSLQDNLDNKADLVNGQIPTNQIPSIALTKPFVVADRAAMLALDVQEGDVAIITGDNADKGSYILGDGPSDEFTSWVLLSISSDAPVQSVNGQVGTVVLSPADIGAAPTSHTHNASDISGSLGASVDASQAMVAGNNWEDEDEPFVGPLSGHIGNIYYLQGEVDSMFPVVLNKADIDHEHSVSDITATGTASQTTYLRGDGSWATPTNTTYSVPTQAEAEAGTATTARAFSAQRVRQSADAAISERIQLVSEFPETPTQGVLYLKVEE